LLCKSGKNIDVLWTNYIIYDKKNSPHLGVSIGTDITKGKKCEERVKRIAYYDSITGLPNRVMLIKELSRSIISAKKNNQKFALLFMDLDNFKAINDRYGHIAGDELLKKFGIRLRNSLQKDIFVSRLGGDEFVILIPKINNTDDVINVSNMVFNQFNIKN
jgi:diguanylate cyclase (GGDEF)-like protein